MSQQLTHKTKTEQWTLAKFIEMHKDNLSEDNLNLLNSLLGLSGFEFTSSVWISKKIGESAVANLRFFRLDETDIQITLQLTNGS